MSIVSTMFMWESGQWLGKNTVWGTDQFASTQQNLDRSKLEASEDNKNKWDWAIEICFAKNQKNIVGKGENSGYQHFLLFQQCFPKASFQVIVW